MTFLSLSAAANQSHIAYYGYDSGEWPDFVLLPREEEKRMNASQMSCRSDQDAASNELLPILVVQGEPRREMHNSNLAILTTL